MVSYSIYGRHMSESCIEIKKKWNDSEQNNYEIQCGLFNKLLCKQTNIYTLETLEERKKKKLPKELVFKKKNNTKTTKKWEKVY